MKTLAFSLVLAALTLTANHLNAQDRGLFGMGPSAANYDYNYSNRDGLLNANINSNTGDGIHNDSFGAPLGSGIAILLAAGAGYAVVRRKRSRKNTMLLLACVALLGFTQCKKEQPLEPTNDGNKTKITLNVDNGGNNGSRVNVSDANVTFTNGDKILVVSNGHYVGTLTHNGTCFSGNITDPVEGEPLYFYFLGNKDTGTLTAGTSGSTSCTVSISDQTDYPHLPVISMAPSDQTYPSDGNQYTASLHNKCSLMEFKVNTPSNQPICITGMNNKVIINFSEAANDGANNGFTYDKDGDGIIKLKGYSGVPAQKWAIVLPQPALSAGADGTAYTNEENQRYKGNRPALDAISSNQFLNSGVSLDVNTEDNSSTVDLSKLVYDYCAKNGETLTGTLSGDYKISIAAGAEVTLSNVNINGNGTWSSGNYAGLNCLGNATINLADGTTNSVKGFNVDYPGIYVPSNYTLTIQGTGTLNASSNGYGAGIGGGFKGDNTINCGNITISGGTVTATGGGYAAGIGSGGNGCSCGTITISGGTVTATGGQYATGIGSGYNKSSCGAITISGGTVEATGGNDGAYGNAGVGIGSSDFSSCGAITIQNTVARVTATKGGSSATNSIGAGNYGTCGTVTILGTAYWSGSAYQNGGDIFLPTSPLYAHVPFGAVPGKFSIDNSRKVYISNGNLQYTKNTGTWSFMSPQYNTVETNDQNVGDNYSNQNIVSLFGWGTSGYDGKYPYATSTSDGSYAAVDLAGTNYDWGVYNTISNAVTGWRTLTNSEWEYLLKTRSYTSYSYAMGTIHSTNGMIIFPDEFNPTAVGVTITSPNSGSSGYVSYSDADWTKMEAAGCVFLPAAGRRPKDSPTTVGNVGTNGFYWTSTIMSNWAAHWWSFSTSGPGPTNGYRSCGYSVRLVKDAN